MNELNTSKVFELRRPHRNLLRYYFLISLMLGPFFFVMFVPLLFRFRTLRYVFDDEGVSMRWGVLFRREISLTYARLQDIHLTSDIVERWLGLARVKLQTASGSAKAEMTIQGLQEYELVRDFLYSRMRGVRAARGAKIPPGPGEAAADDLVQALGAVVDELAAIRSLIEGRSAPTAPAAEGADR